MARYRKNGALYEYTRAYTSLGGIRGRGNGGEIEYMENLYRDYSSDGGNQPESVPGYRRIAKLPGEIKAIYPLSTKDGSEELVIHLEQGLIALRPNDVSNITVLCEVKGEISSAFSFGEYLYLFLCDEIYRIREGGECQIVKAGEATSPYSPILYLDGVGYEQRNLLTTSARERRRIYSTERFAYGNPEIKYRIEDPVLRYCSVIGCNSVIEGELDIPGYTIIGGEEYKVVEVCDSAFANNDTITTLKLGEGVERIGKFAFRENTALKKVITPRSLRIIDNAAFQNCRALEEVYLSGGLEYIGLSLFNFCIALTTIHYSLDEANLSLVENSGLLDSFDILYNKESLEGRVSIPIYSKPLQIDRVLVNGADCEYSVDRRDDVIIGVLLETESPWALDGSEIEIQLQLNEFYSRFDGTTKEEGRVSGKKAITGCRISEKFDGRVFLSGNPLLPGAVFYSATGVESNGEPLYFGEYNYFNDSHGESQIISMMAVRDSLAVFKNRDDGTGSIIYHYGKSTEDGMIPRIYPISSVHSELCSTGPSRNFYDDPVFLSHLGLCAIEHKNLEYDRSISVRSSNINYYLLSEELDTADIFEWQGYLGIAVNGSIYLADSRDYSTGQSGKREYEWYMIKGVGRWDNTTPVYKYSANIGYGIKMHERVDEEVTEQVYSGLFGVDNSERELMLYTDEKGGKYAVCATGENRGGVFSPGRCFTCNDGEHLYFTASNGYLYTFNNDMRGIPPERIRTSADFDPVEYATHMRHRIHPDFYDFDGRAVRYAIRTRMDNCSVPHLAKDTVKGSLIAKIKSFSQASLSLEVATDKNGYKEIVEFSPTELSFYDLDFSAFSFALQESYTLPFSEKEKNWIEKSISIYTEQFRCPIGIENIAFRYRLRGNIKKK